MGLAVALIKGRLTSASAGPVGARCCGIPTYERKGNGGHKQPNRGDVSHGREYTTGR